MSRAYYGGGSWVAAAIGLIWLPVGIVWGGFVLMLVWNWWVPPAFGLASLTVTQAVAVNMVKMPVLWGCMTHEDDEAMDALENAIIMPVKSLVVGSFILGIAWLGHLAAF